MAAVPLIPEREASWGRRWDGLHCGCRLTTDASTHVYYRERERERKRERERERERGGGARENTPMNTTAITHSLEYNRSLHVIPATKALLCKSHA